MLVLTLASSALAIVAGLAAWLWMGARRFQGAGGRVPRPTLDMDRVRAVRQAAEEAALQVALGHAACGRNPFRQPSREAVLWGTSFNARLMELETEAFAPMPAVPAWH
jgi:hypothetical protein